MPLKLHLKFQKPVIKITDKRNPNLNFESWDNLPIQRKRMIYTKFTIMGMM